MFVCFYLVLTDGIDFYVTELKYLNQDGKDQKKIKKLKNQVLRYSQFFKLRIKDSGVYSQNFISHFKNSKIFGIAYTNKDKPIQMYYIIGPGSHSKTW